VHECGVGVWSPFELGVSLVFFLRITWGRESIAVP
jgi:hypothetical protein